MSSKKINTQNFRNTFNNKVLSNKKLLVYLIFVGLSTIFWFLNTLGKTYSAEINYPVTFVNMPTDKVLVNKLPEKLVLRINAYGFDILRYKLRALFASNSFDVKSYTAQTINKESLSEYILYTSNIEGKISDKLASDIKLLQITPDRIVFRFSPMASKKVPVKLRAKLAYKQQFKKNGRIVITPDSVLIKGTQAVLDSISKAKTEMLVLENLHLDKNGSIALEEKEGVTFSPKKVDYHIPVQRFTESSTNVKIQVENLPEAKLLRLFPNEIKVNYFVGMKQYNTVSPEQFNVVVNYEDAINNKSEKLKVTLKTYPKTVYNVRIYPETVSYLIEEKQ